MLNMKKGLAVALAAATVLTFAPTSVFAGTTDTEKTSQPAAEDQEHILTTMNENANVWSFAYKKGKNVTTENNNTLTNENVVVVLTPSNPTGSVTFTQAVTAQDKDTLNNGKWFNYSTTASAWSAAADNKEQNGVLELTAAKNGKTLNFKASMTELRALKTPEVLDITNITGADLATDLNVKVILAPNAVKMNNLKVVLSQAGDSALNRYQNHDDDVYTAREARPTGDIIGTAPKQDLKTKDDYDVALDGKRIEDQTINLATSKDLAFKEIVTNADLEFKSDDNSIATVDKDGIHAKAVGETDVHISTKPTMTAYGVVSVDIHVKVVNIPKAKLTAPSDLTVRGYGVENSTAIGATGTNIQKNSIEYDFVWWDAINQKYESFRTDRTTSAFLNKQNAGYIPLNPFKLSDKQDSVYVESYTGDNRDSYDWNAYLKVVAKGADGYDAPDPVYVKLHFDNTPFELDSDNQELHIGESVQITAKKAEAVSGAAFSYKSYNPAVATVSDKGVITAVSEGSTTVDVTYGGVTKSVKVKVKAYENGQGSTSAPEKVTGVTVSNKKGAKVSVNWTSQNGNVLYRVYKKVGSGKWIAKNVTSNKTTLSVKKGAKVTVKVKAFVKGADGKTVWGPKATSKSLKTDRK